MVKKIVSGGQTGADQAALDTAIKLDIPHGGWISKGRKTENGPLPEKYQLQEMDTDSYAKRTEQNVIDSDGTLIISHGNLTGGTDYTRKMAIQHNRPWIHINLEQTIAFQAAENIRSWILDHHIETLNVAGPRASTDPEIYQAVTDVLETAMHLDLIGASFTDHFTGYLRPDASKGIISLPATVDQAVEKLISRLSLREKNRIANMRVQNLSDLDFSLRDFLRDRFRLGAGNHPLLTSCRRLSGNENMNKDEASYVITEALWKKLQKTHRLRVVE
ncbi:putative molybdenum carrier protein [Thermodesulfobacteriota bacterium]